MNDTILRDLDGIPFAISVVEGLGLPTVSPCNAKYDVMLDGEKIDRVIAFDRNAGFVWINTGRAVGDEWEAVKLSGEVVVEPIDEGF